MKPYISLDIETTGLDPKSHILQIGAIYDDLKTPIEELPKFKINLFYEKFTHAEPYALMMNAKIIQEMSVGYEKLGNGWQHSDYGLQAFRHFVRQFTKDDTEKIVFAGKNVASFDIPMVKLASTDLEAEWFDKICHYKTIDVGSLYFDVFKENVSLSKINKLTGRKEVSHDALDDAIDVVYAIRHKLGIK